MPLNQEESVFSGIKSSCRFLTEEFPDLSRDEFNQYWDVNCETGNSNEYREEKTEKVSDDVVDLLPTDPFGMDISATVTAIGWIEDFGLKNLGFESGKADIENVDDQFLAEVNIVLNNAMRFTRDVIKMKSDTRFTESSVESKSGLNLGEVRGGSPPDALYFSLGYLGVRDLLSVERVCKSMRDAVQNDPLLWRNVHIDCPLSYKLTDDALLQLTRRAEGYLHSLSLVECLKITDNGLKRVIETNPGLTMLNIPGCVRLSIEGILHNLKLLKSVGRPGIKKLRIGARFNVTTQQFEEFNLLLGAQNQKQLIVQKPWFHRGRQLYLSFDDERDIDIETCPRCQQVRQVYDCPTDGCRANQHTPQACRACTFCISRCRNCGRCLSNCDYEETFCLDLICLDCLKQILNCQERQKRVTIFPKQTYLHPQAEIFYARYSSWLLDTT